MPRRFEMRGFAWLIVFVFVYGTVALGAATFGVLLYAAWEHSR